MALCPLLQRGTLPSTQLNSWSLPNDVRHTESDSIIRGVCPHQLTRRLALCALSCVCVCSGFGAEAGLWDFCLHISVILHLLLTSLLWPLLQGVADLQASLDCFWATVSVPRLEYMCPFRERYLPVFSLCSGLPGEFPVMSSLCLDWQSLETVWKMCKAIVEFWWF